METIPAKTILSARKPYSAQWFGVDYVVNLYRGCPHGYVYCDSRSERYGIDNFDRPRKKENALLTLERELASKRVKGIVGIGAMSDPYIPDEANETLTRGALALLLNYGFGVSLETKSPLVTRDCDLLSEIGKRYGANVKLTITARDDALSKAIEPGVAVSSERFRAIKKLSDNNIYTGVILMPVLPFIADTEENIRAIVTQAAASGARYVYASDMGVTLRDRQRAYFLRAIDAQFPTMKKRYCDAFGASYACVSKKSAALTAALYDECIRRGLSYRMSDIIEGYKKPTRESPSLNLF